MEVFWQKGNGRTLGGSREVLQSVTEWRGPKLVKNSMTYFMDGPFLILNPCIPDILISDNPAHVKSYRSLHILDSWVGVVKPNASLVFSMFSHHTRLKTLTLKLQPLILNLYLRNPFRTSDRTISSKVLTVYIFRTEADVGFWAPTLHFVSECFPLGLKLFHRTLFLN